MAELVKERKEGRKKKKEGMRELGRGLYSFLLLFFSLKPRPMWSPVRRFQTAQFYIYTYIYDCYFLFVIF